MRGKFELLRLFEVRSTDLASSPHSGACTNVDLPQGMAHLWRNASGRGWVAVVEREGIRALTPPECTQVGPNATVARFADDPREAVSTAKKEWRRGIKELRRSMKESAQEEANRVTNRRIAQELLAQRWV